MGKSIKVEKTNLLISEPFLSDLAFSRSVILLLTNDDEGSFGLILNKIMPYKVSDYVSSLENIKHNLYFGGPVETNTLHFIHTCKDLKNTTDIGNGIFWNGDLEELKDMIELEYLDLSKIKFFLGYSGWSKNQLEEEIKEKSWINTSFNEDLIFSTNTDNYMWKESILSLGGKYKDMAEYPISPLLN